MDGQGRRIGRPSENILIENIHTLRCSAGVAIGSDSSGGVRNVTVRDCNFNGTQRGFYLKTVRGRGGVTEDIRFHNVAMTNIANEGILLDMKYNPSAQEKDLYNNPIKYEPFTDKTPILRNVEFIGIKGNVQRPGNNFRPSRVSHRKYSLQRFQFEIKVWNNI